MQGLVIPPRDGLTADQVTQLIVDAPAIQYDHGCEIVNRDLNMLEDITEFVTADGDVSRDAYATLHGSCNLTVARDLDWGETLLRPYVVLTGQTPDYGIVSARFNLGVYYATADDLSIGENPQSYAVVGYDILAALADPVGDSYAVLVGASYLDAVRQILVARGYTKFIIDPQASGILLPTSRTWVIDAQTTWLTIINDLLSSIGYAGIWSDWNGYLRVQPYVSPSARAPEWAYDMGDASIVAPARKQHRDLWAAPNRWVFIQSNRASGAAPAEGDGVYTYVNQSQGPSSVQARHGRTITKIMQIDAADQATLVTTAQVTIDADIAGNVKLDVTTSPNPLHWHFDRLTFTDGSLSTGANMIGTTWKLPLNGDDMTQSWTVL